jgi:hypothetical protein
MNKGISLIEPIRFQDSIKLDYNFSQSKGNFTAPFSNNIGELPPNPHNSIGHASFVPRP